MRLGLLQSGDQLPTVKEVVTSIAINPNTVLKAYRELEREGLVQGRPGVGTFVLRTLGGPNANHPRLRRRLERWIAGAREAGLDEESISALFAATLRGSLQQEDIA
jgi:GntR family transcriptional regulator